MKTVAFTATKIVKIILKRIGDSIILILRF